jgi:uncharacterized membrane protein
MIGPLAAASSAIINLARTLSASSAAEARALPEVCSPAKAGEAATLGLSPDPLCTRSETSSASTISALVVGDEPRFSLVRVRERFFNSFWLLPAAFLVGALLLALLTRTIDAALPPVIAHAAPWIVGGHDASVVLSTLATAMLTFLGVVFSIGLVALQLASQQFSPRVLRNYVRSTTIKVALGTFIATFIYPLFSLGYLQELMRNGRAVATVSVAVAMVLALASIAVFIAYVTLTIRGMRIAYAISTVALETRRALRRMSPDGGRHVDVEMPASAQPDRVVSYATRRTALAVHAAQGVLQAVDIASCVRLAARHECVLRLLPQVGQYVASGEPLFQVFTHGAGSSLPTDRQLLRTVDVGPERAVHQDAFYGVRALVDVAAQALSPAVNAPTTAVQVLDRLQDFLALMARRPWPTGVYADQAGHVRLIIPVRSWAQFVDLALTEITEFGAGSPQVTRRLADLLDTLQAGVPVDRTAVLARHRELLAEAVEQRVASYRGLAAIALEPDARGLG